MTEIPLQPAEDPARDQEDTRVVYGFGCTWWDKIQNASRTRDDGYGLPCCPTCGGVLFQIANEQAFLEMTATTKDPEKQREYILWLRGRCFRTAELARHAFDVRDARLA